MSIAIETEISREIIDEFSPHVQLIAFDVDNDIGLFKLQDKYAGQKNFINIDWILKRDDAYFTQLQVEVTAACCGYSGMLSELQSKQVQNQAAHHLSQVQTVFVSFS